MPTARKFSLFAKLPAELRFTIWKISILEHHQDRLVLINYFTQRLICPRSLACSGHFRATVESRNVAIHLYPIRLPVSRVLFRNYPVMESQVDDNAETDFTRYPPQGAVYVSLTRDWRASQHLSTLWRIREFWVEIAKLVSFPVWECATYHVD